MRVIAGKARSLPLKTPASMDTRPTTDRIKETLFNMIQSELPGCIFIDLFAGSGGIGIEAISRGAAYSFFVDNSHQAVSCITDNVKFTKFEQQAQILRGDVLLSLPQFTPFFEKRRSGADIIFMDPPYELGIEEALFKKLSELSFVTEDTLLILEARIDKSLDFLREYGFSIVRQKKYKTNQHIFIKKEIQQ